MFDHSAFVVCREYYFAILAVSDERAVGDLTVSLPCFWKAAPIPALPISFISVPEAQGHDLLVSLRFDR